MEVRRWRRGPRDGHVLFRAQLQVTLDSGGRVVRALALVAVGEQHDDARALSPLLFGGGNEFVNNRLGTVGKVTELGFPENKGVGALHRVAVLKTESGILAEQRVVDPESCLAVTQVSEG